MNMYCHTLRFAAVFCAVLSLISSRPGLGEEIEPNGDPVSATPLVLSRGAVKISGNISPNGDHDYFSFTARADDRVYAAVQTAFSSNVSTDSQLRLFASDGTTEIEFDNSNGTFGAGSSSIAGAVIPATGTYFLRVNHNSPTSQLRGYDLYLQVRSGAPVAETEPNNSFGAPNPRVLWAGGERNTGTDQDWYLVTLAAGDTVFLSLDLDPERDGVSWNGRVGLRGFGDAGDQTLFADDAGAPETLPNAPSEAFFLTVKEAGTYHALVDAADATVGTYHLNITVLPASTAPSTLYTSTNVPQSIGPGNGLVSSTITVPGNPRIAKIRVHLNLNHANMPDLDVNLRSPAGNDVGIFTDIGSSAQQQMDLVLSDDAAITLAFFPAMKGMIYQPELNYRLKWFEGIDAGGVWTLDIRDDANDANGGTLNGWSIEIVEDPGPPAGTMIYSSDFESDDGGFTHSGIQDEWERGLPSFGAITTANSGTNCWKTDLDNTYNANSNQDLFSPDIDLTAATGLVILQWAQRYQLESATFDHAFVEVQEVGGGGQTRTVWEWFDATMATTVGSPAVTIQESAGWGLMHADISDFIGKTIRIRFHFDSDSSIQLAGWAIDDVSVRTVSPPRLTLQRPKRFRTTRIGSTSRTQRLLITNIGQQKATGLRLVLRGPGIRDFRVIRPVSVLLPSATTFCRTQFRPRKMGSRKATLSLLSSAAELRVKLSGRGKAKR